MRALIVFGTRPEAIKLAPVVKAIQCYTRIECAVCTTGQHREMLNQVLRVFDIFPKYDLCIMKRAQDLFDITLSTLKGMKRILHRERPDILIVQGDTTTALAAGLSAYYCKIPIAHVEAGLRTYDRYNPFPEEINRHALGAIAQFHFAPTEQARSNLLREGIHEDAIWVTGNTVVDALLTVVEKQRGKEKQNAFYKYFKNRWGITIEDGANPDSRRLLLVTGHRRESFGEGLRNICWALRDIAEKRTDVSIVYPCHLNPNVQRIVRLVLSGVPNVHVIEPIDYESLVFLMTKAFLILTDSGGMQEEAPSLGKPVLVMRDRTERPEGVKAGTARLVGRDKERIIEEVCQLLDNPPAYRQMAKTRNPYGDGHAAKKIVKILCELERQGILGLHNDILSREEVKGRSGNLHNVYCSRST